MTRQEQTEANRVAQNLVREVGRHASTIAAVRTEACRAAVDANGVSHWLEVARRIEFILADHADPSPSWRHMQRIELYRHRALEAERKAAAGPEQLRADLMEIARQWRELALQAQLLAEVAPTPALDEPRRRRQASR